MTEYSFGKYANEDRWASYWLQLKEILALGPKSVLEAGAGDKTVGNYLKFNHSEIDYKSVDVDAKINPDILASVEHLGLKENSFDVVCAFEVLEHLPFEKFSLALKELGRVSRNFVIISLPHWGRHFSFKIRLPFFKVLKFQFKINFGAPPHKPGEHFWEIGKKEFSLARVKNKIAEAGFEIKKDYVAFESPYHHFFILEKK